MWVKQEKKTGKIRYCERYTDPMTGKKKDVTVTFDKDNARNRREAAQILNEKIASSLEPELKEIRLKELIELYRKHQKVTVKPSTYKRNKFALDTMEEILGKDTLIDRITARYVRDKMLASKKDGGTLNELLKRFKALMRWAFKSDLIDSVSFLDKIDKFPDRSHRTKIEDKYLESSELKKVVNAMTHPVWKLLTEFLVLSGMRIGEVIALEDKDLDLKSKKIRVNKNYDYINDLVVTTKTPGSEDDVVIQPQLKVVIQKLRKEMKKQKLQHQYKSNLFICDPKGKHIHYYSYNKYLRENTEKTVGKSLTCHSLRHTHASLLFEQGFTIDEVARRLRHSDSSVTREIYIHVTKKLKEKDAAKLMAVNLF